MKGYGFNYELEKQHRDNTEWRFGALSLPPLFTIPPEKRREYLPIGEVQRGAEDTMDCASRGPNNVLEALFTYGYQNKLFNEDNLKWLEDTGYVVDNRVVFSDAFVAINSGTTRSGNSLKAPLEAIRKQGLIPKPMLPLEHWMKWEDYMNPNRITKAMYDIGFEFTQRFIINYELVYEVHLAELLKEEMIVLAGYAWADPIGGEYPKSDLPPNHVFDGVWEPKTYIFDNYIDSVDNDFIKKLAPDYDFLDTCYRVFISKETTAEERAIGKSVFSNLLTNGLLGFFFDFWDRFTRTLGFKK